MTPSPIIIAATTRLVAAAKEEAISHPPPLLSPPPSSSSSSSSSPSSDDVDREPSPRPDAMSPPSSATFASSPKRKQSPNRQTSDDAADDDADATTTDDDGTAARQRDPPMTIPEEQPSSIFSFTRKNRIRLLYFLFRISTAIPNPFMTLYMQHVGLLPDQIGTLQAIRPIVTMLSAPVWGGLADGTGRKKSVLVVSFRFFGRGFEYRIYYAA